MSFGLVLNLLKMKLKVEGGLKKKSIRSNGGGVWKLRQCIDDTSWPKKGEIRDLTENYGASNGGGVWYVDDTRQQRYSFGRLGDIGFRPQRRQSKWSNDTKTICSVYVALFTFGF